MIFSSDNLDRIHKLALNGIDEKIDLPNGYYLRSFIKIENYKVVAQVGSNIPQYSDHFSRFIRGRTLELTKENEHASFGTDRDHAFFSYVEGGWGHFHSVFGTTNSQIRPKKEWMLLVSSKEGYFTDAEYKEIIKLLRGNSERVYSVTNHFSDRGSIKNLSIFLKNKVEA